MFAPRYLLPCIDPLFLFLPYFLSLFVSLFLFIFLDSLFFILFHFFCSLYVLPKLGVWNADPFVLFPQYAQRSNYNRVPSSRVPFASSTPSSTPSSLVSASLSAPPSGASSTTTPRRRRHALIHFRRCTASCLCPRLSYALR